MTRQHWLLITVLLFAVTTGAYHWWNGRGLVTIHCEDWPASKVAREIERQSGIVLKTNLPDDVKIRMHVDKVPLAEALETFGTVAEARWRLAYVFAATLPDAHAAVAGFLAGQRPEGWKQMFYPLMIPVTEEPGAAPDPRADPWNVKPAEKAEFQAYAEQAARSVNAAFAFPETWNPPVKKAPDSGPIHKSANALAKAAGGRVLEVFMLERRSRELAGGPPGEGGGGPPPGGEGGPRFDFGRRGGDRGGNNDGQPRPAPSDADRERMRSSFMQRAQAEIDKLSGDKRAAAQAEFDKQRQFFESMRDLPPEERRAKMEERMSDPGMQERMEQRMSEHMARMSPDQRVDRAKGYIQKKEAARNQTDAK
ncbi:MAG: hypothetical protein ABMA13_19230 [Chthoniobacteraceae bacterium]